MLGHLQHCQSASSPPASPSSRWARARTRTSARSARKSRVSRDSCNAGMWQTRAGWRCARWLCGSMPLAADMPSDRPLWMPPANTRHDSRTAMMATQPLARGWVAPHARRGMHLQAFGQKRKCVGGPPIAHQLLACAAAIRAVEEGQQQWVPDTTPRQITEADAKQA